MWHQRNIYSLPFLQHWGSYSFKLYSLYSVCWYISLIYQNTLFFSLSFFLFTFKDDWFLSSKERTDHDIYLIDLFAFERYRLLRMQSQKWSDPAVWLSQRPHKQLHQRNRGWSRALPAHLLRSQLVINLIYLTVYIHILGFNLTYLIHVH